MKTVIEMATDAGAIPIHKDYKQKALVGNENIERFAQLVRAAEREACAKVVENHALGYAEPVWALKLIDTIRARGNT